MFVSRYNSPIFCAFRSIHQSARCSSNKSTELTDEMRSSVRRFVGEEIVPKAQDFDAKAKLPWLVVEKLHGMGLMNVDTPREFGGQGLSLRAKLSIYEELGYGDAGIAVSLMISELAQIPILQAGSKSLKEKYISGICSKPGLASHATSESEAGSDLARAKLSAKKEDGKYILDGEKAWVTNAGVAKWIFVLAATDPDASTGRRFTGFIVDCDAKGVNLGENERKMGLRTADCRGVVLERVHVSQDNIVGEVGGGFRLVMRAFNRVRPVIAAIACGVQRRCLDETTKYSLDRNTFGQAIIKHEGVGFKLAEMATRLEASRLLAHQAAEKVEADVPDVSYYSSIAKSFATESAFKSATDAVQIFGGNGFSSDYPVEKLLRDVATFKIIGGTSEIQRLIITRQLAKKYS